MTIPRTFDDTATYWAPATPDGGGGNVFADNVTVDVFWEDRAERFIDSNGEEQISRAVILVKQELEADGWLFHGSAIPSITPIDVGNDAYVIRAYQSQPGVRIGTDSRVAFL